MPPPALTRKSPPVSKAENEPVTTAATATR